MLGSNFLNEGDENDEREPGVFDRHEPQFDESLTTAT